MSAGSGIAQHDPILRLLPLLSRDCDASLIGKSRSVCALSGRGEADCPHLRLWRVEEAPKVMTTWIFAALVLANPYINIPHGDLCVLGLVFALIKLDEIRDKDKPKWTLVGKWGEGWQWIKK